MRILGIETSCDETAVCLVEAHGNFGADFSFKVLGNALYSQAKLHAEYGGVFPNIAKREHAKNLVPMLHEALRQAVALTESQGESLIEVERLQVLLAREPELFELLSAFLAKYAKPDIDCIAVTHGPGLEPALWVGVNFAKALATAWNIPIVGTNHMEGHIVLSLAQEHGLSQFEFPMLALLISGGHSELVLSRAWQEYELVGQTRDDAAGEAFDKVARVLGLPYPGGPQISRLAQEARQNNLAREIILPRPMIHEDNFDFSFSGLKTAVRKAAEERAPFSDEMKKQTAMEFEDAVADVLVTKTLRAVDQFGANTVVVGGGVSANTYIRERLAQTLKDEGDPAKLLIPPPALATDNALMIALAGYFRAIKKEFADPAALTAKGNLKLA